MHAHSWDLRAELPDLSDRERDEFIADLQRQGQSASLSDADRALCAFAEKLTLTPAKMEQRDVAELRAHGFDDRAIHDATQVIAYFNYINRIADALHVDLEPEMPPDPRER